MYRAFEVEGLKGWRKFFLAKYDSAEFVAQYKARYQLYLIFFSLFVVIILCSQLLPGRNFK